MPATPELPPRQPLSWSGADCRTSRVGGCPTSPGGQPTLPRSVTQEEAEKKECNYDSSGQHPPGAPTFLHRLILARSLAQVDRRPPELLDPRQPFEVLLTRPHAGPAVTLRREPAAGVGRLIVAVGSLELLRVQLCARTDPGSAIKPGQGSPGRAWSPSPSCPRPLTAEVAEAHLDTGDSRVSPPIACGDCRSPRRDRTRSVPAERRRGATAPNWGRWRRRPGGGGEPPRAPFRRTRHPA